MTRPPTTTASARDRLALPIRQSKWAPLFIGWRLFRSIGITNFAIAGFWIFSGRAPSLLLTLIPLGLIVVAAIAILGWWRRTFCVVEGELTVVHGILQREEMTVPLDRVQSVSIDQHLLHRPIGLVKVRIDTAGSPLAEFVVDALDRPTAEALRSVVLEARDAAASERPAAHGTANAPTPENESPTGEPVVLIKRTVPELIKVGLTQNPLTAILLVGPALFLVSQIGETFDLSPADVARFDLPDGSTLIALLAAGGALTLALFFVLWVGSSVVAHHNLTLSRSERGLETKSGLINRRERAASIERIQTVVTRQNPLQRRAGISTLALPTVGGSDALAPTAALGTMRAGGQSIFVPGLTEAEFGLIAPLVLTADEHRSLALDRGISPLAAMRWFRLFGVLPAVVGVAAVAIRFGWWALAVLLWLPLAWLLSRANQRRWRWGADSETLLVSHGLFNRADRYLAWRKIQEVDVAQTWFHRRNGLATVSIATAADQVTVPHLPVATAHALRDVALARVETDPRPFM